MLQPTSHPSSSRKAAAWMALTLTGLLAACAGPGGNPPSSQMSSNPPAVDANDVTANDSGLKIEALRLTAGDYLLDLRYRISDPVRAEAFFIRKTEIQLVDPASGTVLAVPNTPKLGKLRQVARKDMGERSYFMLFANPGKFVKPGTRLALVVGGQRVADLVVEGAGSEHGASRPL